MDKTSEQILSDEWGERISAYLDGELPEDERLEVERRLADDPAAARLAQDFSRLREACAAAPKGVFTDLRDTVIAEIARREEVGEDRVDVAGRLEPEGEFGLPFGRSSRSWYWAGLAVAAAVMIGFYGRPDSPPPRATVAQQSLTPQINEVVHRVQQAIPQTRVVRITTTPDQRRRLEELLASRGFRVGQPAPSTAPERLALQRAGIETSTSGDSQMLLVSAAQPTVRGLIDDLEKEKGIFRVEADRLAEEEAPAQATPIAEAPAAKAQKFVVRISLSKQGAPRIGAPVKPTQRVSVPAGRTPVLFIIQAKPRP